MGEGEGKKDVTDQLEDEHQLEGTQKDQQQAQEDDKPEPKEEVRRGKRELRGRRKRKNEGQIDT